MLENTRLRNTLNTASLVLILLIVGSAYAEEKGLGLTNIELDRFRWKNRVLLIFAPTLESPKYLDQIEMLAKENEGVSDRDLILIEVFEKGTSQCDGRSIHSESAQRLMRRFNVKESRFQALLIGKDGGVKMRSGEPVTPTHLFGLIDAMPMRQQEMRMKGNSSTR
jgi:hypothetical protein